MHAMWAHALTLGVDIHVVRVTSGNNIADLPTRMQEEDAFAAVTRLFETVEAKFVAPVLEEMYYKSETWFELKERMLAWLERPCSQQSNDTDLPSM